MTEEIKEEIKEIIDYLIDEECTRRIKCITIEESKQLLDYIKNLQQENEKLKFENGNLKTNEQINIEVHNKQLEIIKDYKSRCEKAIEYINENLTLTSILDGKKFYGLNDYKFDYQDLLNILNGSDDK